jgi:predicted nucleic acid-binding Zn ribbon protein
MPIYRYQVISDDPAERHVFEVMQRISDAALTHHPDTGQPVRRIITAPGTVRMGKGDVLSSNNLSKNGFTKYERTGDGTYTRTAGTQGPKTIRK